MVEGKSWIASGDSENNIKPRNNKKDKIKGDLMFLSLFFSKFIILWFYPTLLTAVNKVG